MAPPNFLVNLYIKLFPIFIIITMIDGTAFDITGSIPNPKFSQHKKGRKRKKLSLLANIMNDLKLTDTQKTIFAILLFVAIFLPKLYNSNGANIREKLKKTFKPSNRFGKAFVAKAEKKGGVKRGGSPNPIGRKTAAERAAVVRAANEGVIAPKERRGKTSKSKNV